MALPLHGVRVVEVTTMVAGPTCGRVLCDWGASVVKVEPPGGDAARIVTSTAFGSDNAGKKSIVLDLKGAAGLNALHALLQQADVFLSNFRTVALQRLGLTSKELQPRYPQLVVATLTAYGTNGPDKDRPGYDLAAFWARSGLGMAHVPMGRSPQVATLAASPRAAPYDLARSRGLPRHPLAHSLITVHGLRRKTRGLGQVTI